MKFTYDKRDNGIEITGFIGPSIKVDTFTIPNEIDGFKVIGIGKHSFSSHETLKAAKREQLFKGQTLLKANKVIFPDHIEYIDMLAFSGCGIKDLVLPKKLKKIGKHAFFSNFIEHLDLPEGLVEIKDGAFLRNNLEKITIPNSVERIGSRAFSDNSISDVSLGTGIRKIEKNTFRTNKLTKVIIPGNVQIIEEGAFFNNHIQSIDLKNGVQEIHSIAFSTIGENYIRYVKIPSSLKKINNTAFIFCTIRSVMVEPGKNLLFFDASRTRIIKLYLYRKLQKYTVKSFLLTRPSYIYTNEIDHLQDLVKRIQNDGDPKPVCKELEYTKAIDQVNLDLMFT